MNDLRAQAAQIWTDLKAWASQHVAITCLSAAVVILILIAWAR